MSERTVHAALLSAALIVASIFFLFAPVVYAYFSEVSLSYSRVPAWFARTVPARVTASLFSRYNVDSPVAARLHRRATCYFIDEGAIRGPRCTHEVRRGQAAYGPEGLKLAPGMYVAGFELSGSAGCSTAGTADFEVATAGRFGAALARHRPSDVRPGDRVEVPFVLDGMDAAFGNVEFKVTGVSDCVLLLRVDWSVIEPGGPPQSPKTLRP
jgi:hypothetical protein